MLLRALDAAPSEAARRTVTEAFLDAAGPCLELSPGIEPVLARLRNAGTTDLAERYSRWRRELMDRLAANLDVLREWLQRRGAQWIEPLGGFNLFCRLPELDGFAPTRFAHELFEESGVITLPAPAFGLDERRWEEQGFWLRLTFSMERDQLVTALRAIDAFCQRRS
jgi:aspartate/methionine/tyrosine aminotransferase